MSLVPSTALYPVPIFLDNHGAFALAWDPIGRFANKHLRKEQHYTQELTRDSIVAPTEVDTLENTADLGTKALGPGPFEKHTQKVVGVVSKPKAL